MISARSTEKRTDERRSVSVPCSDISLSQAALEETDGLEPCGGDRVKDALPPSCGVAASSVRHAELETIEFFRSTRIDLVEDFLRLRMDFCLDLLKLSFLTNLEKEEGWARLSFLNIREKEDGWASRFSSDTELALLSRFLELALLIIVDSPRVLELIFESPRVLELDRVMILESPSVLELDLLIIFGVLCGMVLFV